MSHKKICKYCGHPINDKLKFCHTCGAPLQGNTSSENIKRSPQKICTKCGYPMEENARFCQNCGGSLAPNNSAPVDLKYYSSTSRKSRDNMRTNEKKRYSFLPLILIILIIAVVMMIFVINHSQRNTNPIQSASPATEAESTTAMTSAETGSTTAMASAETGSTTEASDSQMNGSNASRKSSSIKKAGSSAKEESSFETDAIYISGVDSSNTGDYDKVASPKYYRVTDVDDDFYFGYPKDFFSSVDITGNTITFSTKDSTTLTITKEEAYSSDSIENIDYYSSQAEKEMPYIYYQLMSSKKSSDQWHRNILLLSTDKHNTDNMYYLVTSNGDSTYSMAFRYKCAEKDFDNHTSTDYMIECLYRLFAHSGTSKAVRTYEDFCNDSN